MSKTFEYSERENRARILYRGHYYSLSLSPDELADGFSNPKPVQEEI